MTFEEWKKEYLTDEGGKTDTAKEVISVNTAGPAQYYKPVEVGDEAIAIDRGKELPEIKAYKILSTANEMYVSEKAKRKPRLVHQVDANMTEALWLMKIKRTETAPPVVLITSGEMGRNAIAAYNPLQNVVFINTDTPATPQKIAEGFAEGRYKLSTYIHELAHWRDAEEFRAKYGDIDTVAKLKQYMQWSSQKGRKLLDELKKSGYTIDRIAKEISLYAEKQVVLGRYDELTAEYEAYKRLRRRDK